MSSETREQILSDLSHHPGSSPAAIGVRLSLTPAAIRYHLRQLVGDGFLETSPVKVSAHGRGRPDSLYSIRANHQPGNFPVLVQSLLAALEGISPGEREKIIQLAGQQMASQAVIHPGSRITRLQEMMNFLNEHFYQASWEARKDSPYLFFKQCPYSAMPTWHSSACLIDCAMLQCLMNGPVELISAIHTDQQPGQRCIIRIRTLS
jgi:predicted ArsR family transcriptional regulator